MVTPSDIEKLARLARISITDEEKAQFGKEIESILGYVGEIKEAAKDGVAHISVKNVVREDIAINTDPKNLIESAPNTEGDFITVKKIL